METRRTDWRPAGQPPYICCKRKTPERMVEILTYISFISGGLLVLLLLLSIVGGMDLDLDFDTDADAGGLGYLKGGLTFVCIGSWILNILLAGSMNPALAILIGLVSGAVAAWLLSLFLRFLLSQQEEVNWSVHEALFEDGKVYLRIPAGGTGLVQVEIKGGLRELKARSAAGQEIPTGATVTVREVEGEVVVVDLI